MMVWIISSSVTLKWPAQGINHEVLDDASQDAVAMTFQNGALDAATEFTRVPSGRMPCRSGFGLSPLYFRLGSLNAFQFGPQPYTLCSPIMLYRSKGQPMGSIFLWQAAQLTLFPVFLQLVSQADPLFGGIVERGYVGGGGRRRQVEYFLHDPLPTVDGVGNHAVRGDGEGGGLGEQSAAGMLLLEADLSETIPVHPGDFIVLRARRSLMSAKSLSMKFSRLRLSLSNSAKKWAGSARMDSRRPVRTTQRVSSIIRSSSFCRPSHCSMKPWWKADARLSRSMRRTCFSRIFGCERLPLAASESKSSSGMVLQRK